MSIERHGCGLQALFDIPAAFAPPRAQSFSQDSLFDPKPDDDDIPENRFNVIQRPTRTIGYRQTAISHMMQSGNRQAVLMAMC